jgi:hypothetical protein
MRTLYVFPVQSTKNFDEVKFRTLCLLHTDLPEDKIALCLLLLNTGAPAIVLTFDSALERDIAQADFLAAGFVLERDAQAADPSVR